LGKLEVPDFSKKDNGRKKREGELNAVPLVRMKVETSGIQEAYKKVQSSVSVDPKLVVLQEQLNIGKQQLQESKDINRNTKGEPPSKGAN